MSLVVHADSARLRLRESVERELAALFSRRSITAQAYGAEFSRLWTLAAQQVQGGKLVRPVLLLETHDALRAAQESSFDSTTSARARRSDPQERADVLRIAAAVELLHYAFLLHDDVIDGDLLRRGRPNLIGELVRATAHDALAPQTRHWAESGAMLMGNLLLATTHQVFAAAEVPAADRARLLELLEHTILETTAGEFADVGLGDGLVAPDLTTVLAMTTRKTASYTFELPLRAAVILAGGSPELEDTLRKAGSHLGLAYQLQDDLLAMFGDPAVHGKDPHSDLREGKQTAIVCFARMTSAWPSIEVDFGNARISERAAERVRRLLRECGAERFVQGLIDEQLAAFTEVLAGSPAAEEIPGELRGVLLNLAERLEGRKS